MARKYYKKNRQIRHPKVRLIGEDGENLGVIDTNEAREKAGESGLDLVMITEQANPPVAKILDFNKFLYEQEKKEAQAKANSKKSELKEFRIGATIDDHAIGIRTKRAREFLEDGNQVRITVQLRGRENAHPELGFEKIEKFMDDLEDIAKEEKPPQKQGNTISVTLVKK